MFAYAAVMKEFVIVFFSKNLPSFWNIEIHHGINYTLVHVDTQINGEYNE